MGGEGRREEMGGGGEGPIEVEEGGEGIHLLGSIDFGVVVVDGTLEGHGMTWREISGYIGMRKQTNVSSEHSHIVIKRASRSMQSR